VSARAVRFVFVLTIAGVGLLASSRSAQAQAAPPPATGQTQPPAQAPTRLRVFLDCDCFSQFMREEIEWVDFVRQPQDADVTVLSASSSTGGGGREVVLRFIGAGRLQGVDNELKSVSQSNDTEDARRRLMLRTMTAGLLWYAERAGVGGALKIDVEGGVTGQSQTAVKDDPWRAWVFSVRGGGSLDRQESNKEWNWEASVSADRVTEKWILSFNVNSDTQHEEFNLDEEDEEPFKVVRRERNVNWFGARGLGPHWSIGLDGGVSSSTFGNQRFAFSLAPTVEYNIYPYADYASRQLRIQYAIGVDHARYNEITLFDKLRETNPGHSVEVSLQQVQKWGELDLGFEFRQYLHDTSKYRVEVNGELSFRITRGLSLDLDGSASRIRDQLSLPRRGATPEEVLLRLRELQSSYQVDFSVDLTYRFGSIFNNIVNPRFGRN
jgi:hypothetical protein